MFRFVSSGVRRALFMTSSTVAGGLLLAGAAGAGQAISAGQPIAGAHAETDNYVAEISTTGNYKAGTEGVVKITLASKGEYHINAQYPYKFKTPSPAPDGVTYPKPVLGRADGSFEQTKASLQLPFVAAKPGKVTVGGTFHLSVCSAANCVTDKVPLEISVDVK